MKLHLYIFVLIILSGIAIATDINTGLIHTYKLENCGVGGIDGDPTGGDNVSYLNLFSDPAKVAGVNGSGCDFDGNDGLATCASPALDSCGGQFNSDYLVGTTFDHDMTWCMYVKDSTFTTYNHWLTFKGNVEMAGGGDDTSGGAKNTNAWSDAVKFSGGADGAWHQWCFTFEASTNNESLYYDGVHKQTKAGVTPYDFTTTYDGRGSTIGAWIDGSSEGMTGTIDEIYLWNRNLASTEIAAQYNNFVLNSTGKFDLSAPSPPGSPNASIDMNLTTNYSLLGNPIPSMSVLLNGTNLNSTATCYVSSNESTLNFTTKTLQIGNTTNVTTSTSTALREEWVRVNATCFQTGSSFVSPDYDFYYDTNSNPTVTLTIADGYSVPNGGYLTPSPIINGTNWVTSVTCTIEWSASNVTCGFSTINAASSCMNTGPAPYEASMIATAKCNGDGLYYNVGYYMWSTPHTVFMDNIKPIIMGTGIIGGNDTVRFSNINGSFDFADSNLYGVNITIDNSIVVFNVTGINLSTYSYSLDYNISSLLPGRHYLRVRASDSHTSEKLKEKYTIEKPFLSDYLSFTTKKNSIEIRTLDKDSLFNPFSYDEKKDRYTFSLSSNSAKQEYTFVVTTKEELHIIEGKNEYGGTWMVSGDNWIDFYNPSEPEAKIKIKQTSQFTAAVSITGLKNPQFQQYESVGELNYNVVTYSFITFNATLTYPPTIPEGTIETVSALFDFGILLPPSYSITHEYNGTYTTTTAPITTASTIFTNTTFNATVVTNGVSNIAYGYWFFNTTSENVSIPWQQLVGKIQIDNCTASTTPTVNMTFYDENTPNLKIVSTDDVIVSYWTNPSLKKNASYTMTGRDSYNLCIFPSDGSFYADIYLHYSNPTGFTHRYYVYNVTLSNATLYLRAYNSNTTTGYSDAKITVRNLLTYNYLNDVVVHLERFYPGENAWRNIQMDHSDDYGLTLFDVLEQTTDYRFKFFDTENNLLKTSETMKFTCIPDLLGNKVCEYIFLLTPYTEGGLSPSLRINYTFNNATSIINVSWNDPINATHSLRLLVTKELMSGSTTICDSTVSGSFGSVTCNVSGYAGQIYIRVLSSASPERNIAAYYLDLAGTILRDVVGRRESSLWGAGIAVTIAMIGVFSPAAAVISAIIGLIIAGMLGLTTAVTALAIIVLCALGIVIGLRVRR